MVKVLGTIILGICLNCVIVGLSISLPGHFGHEKNNNLKKYGLYALVVLLFYFVILQPIIWVSIGYNIKPVTAQTSEANENQHSLNATSPFTPGQTYKGIDISRHQVSNNLDLSQLTPPPDFVIIRATYTGYGSGNGQLRVDSGCDHFFQKAKQLEIPRGIYHYTHFDTSNSAQKEAEWFVSNTKG